jgi:hypothetical protein
VASQSTAWGVRLHTQRDVLARPLTRPPPVGDSTHRSLLVKQVRNWESVEIAKAMNVSEGGVAPELIQGRLAMLGWLGVIFAEKVTGQTAMDQVRPPFPLAFTRLPGSSPNRKPR